MEHTPQAPTPPFPQLDPMLNHYVVLGKLTVSFSHLESIMKIFIGEILHTDNTFANVITTSLSFKKLTDVLGSLFRLRATSLEQTNQLTNLLKRAIALENQRNTFVHSFWHYDLQQQQTIRLKSAIHYKDGFKVSLEPSDYLTINNLCLELDTVAGEIALLLQSLKRTQAAKQ